MAKRPDAVTRAAQLADEKYNETYTVETEAHDGHPEPQEQPGPQEQPEPQQPEPQQPPAPQPEENFEQKYRSLKGKYDAEVPRMTSRARMFEAENTDLRKEVADLRREVAAARLELATAESGNRSDTKSLATDDEKEEYGEEFTAFVERIAKQAAQKTSSNLTETAPKSVNEVQPTRTQPSGQTVYATLDAQVPEWRTINKDPEFLGWLQVDDPLSGHTRHTMLSQAFSTGDANRVLAFFKSYIQQERGGSSTAPQPQSAPAQPVAPKGKLTLEQLAGPRQSASTAQPREPVKEKQWTGRDIDLFYKDVQKGNYRHRPDEKAKIEEAIGRALAEGRVQPS